MSEEKIRCSVTDTKQAILKAYKSHLDEINANGIKSVNTNEVAKKRVVDEAVTTAKSCNPVTIEEQAMLLQKTVISQIREVIDGLAERKEKFDEIDIAIEAKRKELNEIFGIETAVNSFAALIEAKKSEEIKANKYINNIMTEADEKAKSIIESANITANEILKKINETKNTEEIEKKRRNEEFNYNFLRDAQIKTNKLNDELALKARSLDDREAHVTEREASCNELDKKVISLENELALLKASTDQKIKDEVEKTKKDCDKSSAIQLNIVNSKHGSDLQIKDAQIQGLTTQVQDMKTLVERLQSDLDKANSKVQEVAMRALQSQAEAARPIVFGNEQQSTKK